MVDEFELAFQAINTQPKDEYEVAFNELQLSGLVPQARKEQYQKQSIELEDFQLVVNQRLRVTRIS